MARARELLAAAPDRIGAVTVEDVARVGGVEARGDGVRWEGEVGDAQLARVADQLVAAGAVDLADPLAELGAS